MNNQSDAAWKHLVAILRPFWYSTKACQVFTGADFVAEYGKYLYADDSDWVKENVRNIVRNLDGYGVEFVWEAEK